MEEYRIKSVNIPKYLSGYTDKDNAERIILQNDFKLKSILGFIIQMAMCVGVIILTDALAIFLLPPAGRTAMTGYALAAFDALLILLFVLPCRFGLLKMSKKAASGEMCDVCDIFAPYGELPRMWLMTLFLLLPALLSGAIVLFVEYVYSVYVNSYVIMAYFNALSVTLEIIRIVMIILACLPGIYFTLRWSFVPIYCTGYRMKPAEACRMSYRATEGRFFEIIKFYLSFLGWLLLGVITLGVTVICHSAHYFRLSYALFAERAMVNEEKNREI